MAPIEPDLSNSNKLPIALLSTYLSLTSVLIYTISHRVLFKAHKALPPSQATRFRQSTRRKHIEAFAALALLSLAVATYFGYSFLKLSYQVWAYERGEAVPTGLFGRYGIFSQRVGRLQLGRWLHDTDLISELWEIALERARRRWWSQQLLLTSGPWCLYVAIEGQRRNIPYLWAFIALAPLVSLSFAMNAFFLAILWVPLPLPAATPSTTRVDNRRTNGLLGRLIDFVDSFSPSKPSDWAPHSAVYIVPLVYSAFDTLLLTLSVNTRSFKHCLRNSAFNLIFPLVLPRILPLAAGKSSASEATKRSRALTTFRTSSVVSILFYVLQTLVSLVESDPGAHRHRHSLLHLHLEQDRSGSARTQSAAARVLGSITDHPSIGRVGWDVILCGITLAAWASIRAEPQALLRVAGWVGNSELEAASDMKALVSTELKQILGTEAEVDEGKTPHKRRGRKTKGKEGQNAADEDGREGGEASESFRPVSSGREVGTSGGFQGDEETKAEWENSAMAWGIMVLGGLACGASSVLGAEVGL